jgi:hypothetical protein
MSWPLILALWTKGSTLSVEEIAEDLTKTGAPCSGVDVAATFAAVQPERSSSIVDGWLLMRGIKRIVHRCRSSASRFVYEINPLRNTCAVGYVELPRTRRQTCSCPVSEPIPPIVVPYCLGRLGRRLCQKLCPRLPLLRVPHGLLAAA